MKRAAALMIAAAALSWRASAAPPVEMRRAPAPAELPGKPGGPIAIEYRLAGDPVVGVALEIAVTARVDTEIEALRIEAAASSPRTALVTPPLLTSVASGVYTWTVTVVPLAADAGYLNVIVSGSSDGVAQARTVTIPLRSAADAGAAPRAVSRSGETLIALPVEESP